MTTDIRIGTTDILIGTGQANTGAIIGQTGHTGSAAKICDDYSVTVGSVTYNDWFLPSRDELNKSRINKAAIGGFNGIYYWSSSEYFTAAAYVWGQNFNTGFKSYHGKSNFLYLRAVRAF